MSKISLLNFETVLDATEDLKAQFREMQAKGKTPRDFGLMVKESPDILETTMLVTSRNKLGTSQSIVRTLNYSASPIDTSKLYKSKELNQKNKEAVFAFVANIKNKGILLNKVNGRYLFKDVDKFDIGELLKRLNLPLENRKFDRESLYEYISKTNVFEKWDVVIATGSSKINNLTISNIEIPAARRSFEVREEENYIRVSGSNNRLLEPGIFNSGLTESQIQQVKQKNKNPIARDYLSVEGRNPLFIIYPVELINEEKDEEKQKILDLYINDVILGFGIGFPSRSNEVKIKFRANKRKIEELTKVFEEDEDDDFED